MGLKGIPWFNKGPSLSASPQGIESYVGGQSSSPMDTYTPRRQGILSGIGQAMSGVSAPFVGDMDYALKQAQLQQQRDLADMEFQKFLIKNKDNGFGKPVFTVGPDGNLMQVQLPGGGNPPKGSQVISNPNAPTADMKNNMVTVKQVSSLMDDLKSQAYGLKGGYAGMEENVKSVINRGKGKSADYKLYNDSLHATSVAFYRAVTGDTRLSDADAKTRAYPIMWKTSEHTDVRDKKFGFMERMVSAREKLLEGGINPESLKPGEFFDMIKKEAESGTQTFNVGGKIYNIPADKVEAFKKAKKL